LCNVISHNGIETWQTFLWGPRLKLRMVSLIFPTDRLHKEVDRRGDRHRPALEHGKERGCKRGSVSRQKAGQRVHLIATPVPLIMRGPTFRSSLGPPDNVFLHSAELSSVQNLLETMLFTVVGSPMSHDIMPCNQLKNGRYSLRPLISISYCANSYL
jgi:hypothetical protein